MVSSQPTCACHRPLTTPFHPGPNPWWGECGSPSLSESAWCLRWSVTHCVTGPWQAIEPRIAQTAVMKRVVLKARCENSLWKPMVMPSPHATYMTANMMRSMGPTATPQSSPVTDSSASGGTTMAMSVMMRAEVSGFSRTVATRGCRRLAGSAVLMRVGG